eukprot:jgi/Tetstr1/462652/TSEL_007635.t1
MADTTAPQPSLRAPASQGYLQLAENGTTATEADRVFTELAQAKFCTPKRIAVSGQLYQLRRAFDDKTLKIGFSADRSGQGPCRGRVRQGLPRQAHPQQVSAEMRSKQREQAATARKAAATAAAVDKAKALELRLRLDTLLDHFGLLRNPNKGVWEPT